MEVGFEGDQITMDIPKKGVISQGWRIWPRYQPSVSPDYYNWQPHSWLVVQLTGRANSPFRIMPQVSLLILEQTNCIHELLSLIPMLLVDNQFITSPISSASTQHCILTNTQILEDRSQNRKKENPCEVEVSNGSQPQRLNVLFSAQWGS